MVIQKSGKVQVRHKSVKSLDEKLFIGTLGVNCTEYTRRCINTVRTSCKEVRFVYIDNGSTEQNVADITSWKKENEDITDFLIGINGYNAGVAVGWNQLIKMALEWGATKILICNNDIAFGPHTIDGMVEAYDKLRQSIPETVMVTATNHTKNPHELAKIGQKWDYHEHPDFSCFMITKETIDRVGLFCEDYDPAFFEDNDMHWRILLMGYKAFGTDWAPYSHIASRTRHGNPNLVTHENFRRNKIAFFRNMMTYDVDQKIADSRYAAWLSAFPGVEHPDYRQVLEFCSKTSPSDLKVQTEANWAIDDTLRQWLKDLTITNCPR